MEKHPYITSKGAIIQIVEHLRKSFPATLDASTLKKLGIAPKNETYLINILRFIGIIDESGKKTSDATKVFTLHEDDAFRKGLSKLVENAYSELISLHGAAAWTLDANGLITFFRQHDQTSAIVGKRQALTFEALAALCGHQELPAVKATSGKVSVASNKKAAKKKGDKSPAQPKPELPPAMPPQGQSNFGLTVRVEINLPSDGDQDTYDRIFKSIRENLLNGG